MYIIRRTDQGGYVAPPGSKNSYTKSALKARRFDSKEEAERNRCVENEVVINLNDLINAYS